MPCKRQAAGTTGRRGGRRGGLHPGPRTRPACSPLRGPGPASAVCAHPLGTPAALGLPAHDVERIRIAGLVHDIGKIGMPEHILRKPGRLTDEEFAAAKAKILGI